MNISVFKLLTIHILLGLTVDYGVSAENWHSPLDRIQSRTSAEEQTKVVQEMLKRKLPNQFQLFDIRVQPDLGPPGKDTFKILPTTSVNKTSVIEIIGSSGVAASYGLLHYLKKFCHAHVSWEADQLQIPAVLPLVYLKVTSKDRFRYYQNVCTVSYSFVWWDWQRWERHIDWMALNGINLPLAFTAQEAIWSRVYKRMNLTQQELDDHFAGPAFLAWGRMGNIKKWGGPLSSSWLDSRLELQHKILSRMRGFGMTPVMPAFAGHVPDGILRVYPEANVTKLRNWGHFDDEYTGTLLLDPTDPLFVQIGSDFIRELKKEFNGTDHLYNCDSFNEMSPTSDSPEYLSSVGSSIFLAMTTEDPEAIWVMQGWLFVNDKFWTYDAAKALITSVPQGRMLVLDLFSDKTPIYSKFDSYFGQPFIFCMLHDFGGVKGMYGSVQVLLTNLESARNFPNVTLSGIGLTMEGIEQNYVVYDFMLELGWKPPTEDISTWAAAYARRRYGGSSQKLLGESWRLLMNGVYNAPRSISYHGDHILMMRRPDFKRWALRWYRESDLITSWDLMIESAKMNQNLTDGLNNQETFRHDLVDLTRQVLQIRGDRLIQALRFSYWIRSEDYLKESWSRLSEMLEDLDQLLGTSEDFLLGKWLKDATQWATTEEEMDQYRRNSLHQVTLWGPTGEIVDYAVKQWNGLINNYTKPRWRLFFIFLQRSLRGGSPFNQEEFNSEVFLQVEQPFAMGTDVTYISQPDGDPVESAISIHEKYRKYFNLH